MTPIMHYQRLGECLDVLLGAYATGSALRDGVDATDIQMAATSYSSCVLEEVKERWYTAHSEKRPDYHDFLNNELIRSHDARIRRVYELASEDQSSLRFFPVLPFRELTEERVFELIVKEEMGKLTVAAFIQKYFRGGNDLTRR